MHTLVDCAIIGGGVSGLYAGWRLATGVPPVKRAAAGPVAVFEQSQRLGGRLDTGTIGSPGVPVEFGAMRYFPRQKLLHALLHDGLPGLTTAPFPSTELRRLYLRGVSMLDQPPPPNPFLLVGAEQGKSPFELLAYAILTLVPNALTLTPTQWEVVKAQPIYLGYSLRQLGFWNLLATVLSNEAYQYVFDALGIESVLSNWNAGEAIQLLSFILGALASGPDGVFYGLEGGWSRLADTLAEQLTAGGGQIFRGHRLVALLPRHGLEFTAGDQEYVDVAAIQGAIAEVDALEGPVDAEFAARVTLVFAAGGGLHVVRARSVILALPRRALELVGDGSPMLRQALAPTLDLVDAIPAVRIYLSYPGPWWTTFGWTYGYSVTDLPIHQVFYGMGVGPVAADNARVLMASYADFSPSAFWEPLIALDQESALQQNTPSITSAFAQRQLQLLHQMSNVVPPTAYAMRDWSADPYGGAWHAWRPNVDVAAAIRDIRQPMPTLPVFVCGEAYASMQGWIEGALMSTEGMLLDHFGLQWPAWLPTTYDFGPERAP